MNKDSLACQTNHEQINVHDWVCCLSETRAKQIVRYSIRPIFLR